jgi:hypothetical protein
MNNKSAFIGSCFLFFQPADGPAWWLVAGGSRWHTGGSSGGGSGSGSAQWQWQVGGVGVGVGGGAWGLVGSLGAGAGAGCGLPSGVSGSPHALGAGDTATGLPRHGQQ